MPYEVVALGEVLWDLLPGGKQLGGAPTNFAFHCRQLGASARIVTRVGDDPPGHEVIDRFRDLGLPHDMVQVDRSHPTGTVEVELSSEGQPRYTIIEDVAWDQIETNDANIALARRGDALCFGSLAQRHPVSRDAIQHLAAVARPDAIRVFDVNLRPPFVDRTIVERSLELANVVKLNDHELLELAGMFGLEGGEREMIGQLEARFGLRLVALTRGEHGSLLRTAGAWSELPGRPVPVVDTIGAGDSFTAALVMGLLWRVELRSVHQFASDIAAYVCTQAGGTPEIPLELRLAVGNHGRGTS